MKPFLTLVISLLGFAGAILAWTIPNIDVPTFTYQCMPMRLSWRDGSPPYTVWFESSDTPVGNNPKPGFAAWYNLTGQTYLVPCKARAGSTLTLVLKDSTGWISTSYTSFVVLPSSDSSCLKVSDGAGLAQSQSYLSTIIAKFQQSVVSAISVSATATPAVTTAQAFSSKSIASTRVATSLPTLSEGNGIHLPRILGPVLGCFFGVLIGVALSICYVRRRRKKLLSSLDPHIPLSSNPTLDLLAGESEQRVDSGTQGTQLGPAGPTTAHIASVTAPAPAPRTRLQLHDGSSPSHSMSEKLESQATSSQSNPLRDSSIVEGTDTAHGSGASRPQPHPPVRDHDIEQRAEELSAPELERLAALVARRLERVRGAPPQYRATDED